MAKIRYSFILLINEHLNNQNNDKDEKLYIYLLYETEQGLSKPHFNSIRHFVEGKLIKKN